MFFNFEHFSGRFGRQLVFEIFQILNIYHSDFFPPFDAEKNVDCQCFSVYIEQA